MTEPLTTLSAFKRALAVGSRWETRYSAMLPDPENPKRMVATVSKWQRKDAVHTHTNSVAFSINDHPDAIAAGIANPRRNGSWLWYPKAALCSFPDGAVRISHGDEHHWREYQPLTTSKESVLHDKQDPRKVWTVATDTACCGWQPGTVEDDGKTYADIYLTRHEAEREVADMIRERLTLFLENPAEYADLADALDCGFEAVEGDMDPNGEVFIGDALLGTAPPAISSRTLNTAAPLCREIEGSSRWQGGPRSEKGRQTQNPYQERIPPHAEV